MADAALRLVEKDAMDKTKALDAALSQIERAFGKGSIMRLGQNEAVVDVETVSTFMVWQGQPAILGVLRNITERKEAEAVLAETQRRLSAVTENMPGAVYQRVLTSDGKVSFPYVSAGIHEVTGLTPEEIVQDTTPFFDRIREDFRDEYLACLKRSAETLEPLNIEIPVADRAGGKDRDDAMRTYLS